MRAKQFGLRGWFIPTCLLCFAFSTGLPVTAQDDPFGADKQLPPDPFSNPSRPKADFPEPDDAISDSPRPDALAETLQQEFRLLAQKSQHAKPLLKAEQLLRDTNNSSHWTNYFAATRLLRQYPDKAAIPLLLRYMIVHAEPPVRGDCDEYLDTIAAITGHRLDRYFSNGHSTPQATRTGVANIVQQWWKPQAATLKIKPAEMSTEQLTVVVDGLLNRVRKSGGSRGSGGAADSAYLYYHIVTYGVFRSSDDVVIHAHELQPAMTELVLQRMGCEPFPFHAIPILSELRKHKMARGVERIIDDPDQPSVRRLVCLFALVRAGEPLRTDCLLDIVANDQVLAHRLIAILSLRYGGQQAMPTLLEQLDDPNIEVCTAAACALQDIAPENALAIIDRRVRESFEMPSPPLLLLGRYQDYDSEASRDLLTNLVRDIVEDKLVCPFPDRVLSEFVEHCIGQSGSALHRTPGSDKAKLKLALLMAEEKKVQRQQRQRQAVARLENAAEQLRVATEIEQLRRTEYKRLLALQGDDVVSPEQAEQARQALVAVQAEVKLLQQALQTTRLDQDLSD